jgi:hypothetical protein
LWISRRHASARSKRSGRSGAERAGFIKTAQSGSESTETAVRALVLYYNLLDKIRKDLKRIVSL